MASQPIPPPPGADPLEPERTLTQDEWWDFVLSLEGSAKQMLAEVGGGKAWVRFLRDEEDEPEIPEV